MYANLDFHSFGTSFAAFLFLTISLKLNQTTIQIQTIEYTN